MPNQLKAGLDQIEGYLERLHLATGWLVIFDRRLSAPAIAERLKSELHTTLKGFPVKVIYT
jgi:hypothetical protein